MAEFKPVSISKGSFAFCRTTVAGLLWLSVIFQFKWLVVVTFIIMLLSALLKVRRAPLILIYKYTIDKINQSENVIVDEKGISFSHWVGAIFSVICIVVLYFGNNFAGWVITAIFAVLQTLAAFGFCSALKLHGCMTSGNCCRVGKFVKKARDNKNA